MFFFTKKKVDIKVCVLNLFFQIKCYMFGVLEMCFVGSFMAISKEFSSHPVVLWRLRCSFYWLLYKVFAVHCLFGCS